MATTAIDIHRPLGANNLHRMVTAQVSQSRSLRTTRL